MVAISPLLLPSRIKSIVTKLGNRRTTSSLVPPLDGYHKTSRVLSGLLELRVIRPPRSDYESIISDRGEMERREMTVGFPCLVI